MDYFDKSLNRQKIKNLNFEKHRTWNKGEITFITQSVHL